MTLKKRDTDEENSDEEISRNTIKCRIYLFFLLLMSQMKKKTLQLKHFGRF